MVSERAALWECNTCERWYLLWGGMYLRNSVLFQLLIRSTFTLFVLDVGTLDQEMSGWIGDCQLDHSKHQALPQVSQACWEEWWLQLSCMSLWASILVLYALQLVFAISSFSSYMLKISAWCLCFHYYVFVLCWIINWLYDFLLWMVLVSILILSINVQFLSAL